MGPTFVGLRPDARKTFEENLFHYIFLYLYFSLQLVPAYRIVSKYCSTTIHNLQSFYCQIHSLGRHSWKRAQMAHNRDAHYSYHAHAHTLNAHNFVSSRPFLCFNLFWKAFNNIFYKWNFENCRNFGKARGCCTPNNNVHK